ncbi:MAG: hypothetical protein U0930_18260 [Pirellulales bacterium]
MQRWLKLFVALGLVYAIWFVALPSMTTWRPVREHIDRMQSADIQVDAMFYSELSFVPGL